MGNPGQVNYASSKAALIGFTKSLALEIGSRNVTVECDRTRLHPDRDDRRPGDEAKRGSPRRIALKRLGTPDDIAYATVFLHGAGRATSRAQC